MKKIVKIIGFFLILSGFLGNVYASSLIKDSKDLVNQMFFNKAYSDGDELFIGIIKNTIQSRDPKEFFQHNLLQAKGFKIGSFLVGSIFGITAIALLHKTIKKYLENTTENRLIKTGKIMLSTLGSLGCSCAALGSFFYYLVFNQIVDNMDNPVSSLTRLEAATLVNQIIQIGLQNTAENIIRGAEVKLQTGNIFSF